MFHLKLTRLHELCLKFTNCVSANIDEATNETIYNDSSSAIGRTMPANTIVITSISLGVVILGGIMGEFSF